MAGQVETEGQGGGCGGYFLSLCVGEDSQASPEAAAAVCAESQ